MELFPLIKETEGTITETHKWAQCREQWIGGSPAPSAHTNITALVSVEQGWRGGCKMQNVRKSAMKQSPLETAVRIRPG